jgi:hypothetical protein
VKDELQMFTALSNIERTPTVLVLDRVLFAIRALVHQFAWRYGVFKDKNTVLCLIDVYMKQICTLLFSYIGMRGAIIPLPTTCLWSVL